MRRLLMPGALVLMSVVLAVAWAAGVSSQVRTAPVSAARFERLRWDHASPAARRLAEAAMGQVGRTVTYDASYVELSYPGGDVPIDRGVCTDVVVRAFREIGVDLQVEVHEDMTAAFGKYPSRWGLRRPDSSIDHRRVPNLQVFFRRKGKALPVTHEAHDFLPGDVVTWKVFGRPHTGIVSTVPALGGQQYCIVHNIGAGAQIEDRLFGFPVTGHFRWF